MKANLSVLFRRRHLLLFSCIVQALPAMADDYFNPAMLEQNDAVSRAVDLSDFAQKDQQAPGNYHVSLLVNGTSYDARDIQFVRNTVPGGQALRPCLPAEILKDIGVRVDSFPALAQDGGQCPDLATAIPESRYVFDFRLQQLRLTLPQVAMDNAARGYIPPEKWDEGIPAALMNYQLSGSHTDYSNRGAEDNQYLNLRNGLNLGAWRLRNNSTYTRDDEQTHWDSSSTYLQRDFAALKGELTVGDAFTDGDVFDAVQFRGANLSSDDNMLPDSMKGFAPVIHGIARSNARVTVRQNGYVIYQSYVSPGAFAINDLYPTSNSGDLDVTITESDGSESHFTQPYAAVPLLQREGRLKYDITAGRYHTPTSQDDPFFGQLTLIQGLPRGGTLYGGTQLSERYRSLALGYGQNLGSFGALSADVTHARAELNDGSNKSGEAYRALYSRSFASSGTTLQLTGYRYASEGFYTFADATGYSDYHDDAYNDRNGYRQKDRMQLTLSQSLAGYGSLYASASRQHYWSRTDTERYAQVGYSSSVLGVSYSLSYSYTESGAGNDGDQQVALNFSVPLDKYLRGSWATYNITTDNHGRTAQQAGLSGTLLRDRNLSYNVQQSYANQGTGNSGAASLSYLGSYGQVSAGYNYSDDQRQVNYGASGGVLLHQYGVTLSQQLGETVALVRAPGAKGVSVQNQTGIRTDWRGYTVQPYVMPYRKNVVSLAPSTLPDDTELKSNSKTVIPTQGAVVLADFETRSGYKALVPLTWRGRPVPFGAVVTDVARPDNSSIVSDNGQVYLTGLQKRGVLNVKWGAGDAEHCTAHYTLPLQEARASMPLMPETTPCL